MKSKVSEFNKKKIEKIKLNAHILTLSATPIPRTLQSFFETDKFLIKIPPINRVNGKLFNDLWWSI